MKVEQIYTGCLAHAAYYIESKGEAAIFDPLREVNPYIQKAENDHAKIKYVFETHFHADFVSGHLDLQKKTGAKIVFGPNAKPGYEALVAEDGQIFKIGDYKVKVIHTPGHTMESTTYLLIDDKGNEHGIITGDTLFIGDVGRPDLAQHVVSDLTEDKLAGYLFDSLRHKIMPLKDDLMVYPNHGAGSACATSWEDLTKPVYKGHIAMPNPASSGTGYMQVSAWLQNMGEDQAWNYMRDLDKNIAHYTHSGSKPCVQAGMGEVAIGISMASRGAKLKTQGAPLAVITPKGIGWESEAVGLVKESDAAKRVVDWSISKAANELYVIAPQRHPNR